MPCPADSSFPRCRSFSPSPSDPPRRSPPRRVATRSRRRRRSTRRSRPPSRCWASRSAARRSARPRRTSTWRPSTRRATASSPANAATSVGGRLINYAVVGDPSHVTPQRPRRRPGGRRDAPEPAREPGRRQRRAGIRAGHPLALGQRPRQRGERRRRRARTSLYNLADRSDCVVDDILANAIVVILPIQNPDGREDADPPQPQRLRHEPRLVRPDPARDRRQARGPPQVPADALHRRPRVRPAELLLPAERRSRVPRDPRPGPRLDQRPLQPGDQRAVRPREASSSSTARRTTSSRSCSATRSRRPASTRPG